MRSRSSAKCSVNVMRASGSRGRFSGWLFFALFLPEGFLLFVLGGGLFWSELSGLSVFTCISLEIRPLCVGGACNSGSPHARDYGIFLRTRKATTGSSELMPSLRIEAPVLAVRHGRGVLAHRLAREKTRRDLAALLPPAIPSVPDP